MVTKKDLVTAVLLTFCLTTVMLTIVPTRSAPSDGTYDPWYDVNDDGVINIFDIVGLTSRYGKTGTPIEKASVEYDSGWLNITDKQGQVFIVTHDLNIYDWNNESITVDIAGKKTPASPIQRLSTGAPGINRTYGGTNTEVANSVVQTSDGGYALAGYTSSYGAGGQDMWLVKTDSAGNHLWNKTYGGTEYDGAYYLIQTSDGGYALGGYTGSFGAGYRDMWLVKTDGGGNVLWNKTYGGTDYDEAYSLAQTSDGGYALAGFTYSLGAGLSDMWLVKTDGAGNMQWGRTYGGTGYEEARSVIQTIDGGYALGGFTGSFGAGSYDMWLVKTDGFGNMLWSRAFGGTGSDGIRSVVQTSNGGYALAGYTYSFGVGDSDMWLIRTDQRGDIAWSGISVYIAVWGLDILAIYRDNTNTDWNYIRIRISMAKIH